MTHQNSLVVQKDDYYPFGMSFNSYTRPESEGQEFKYGGNEEQQEWFVYDFNDRIFGLG
ncbi:hypothetical protein [Echinicola strongylocentroti]|uniref:hypothetical protein n=1 Tax=Echinicola strongylocentroti TaxID=1795355 RepID=UPI0013A6A230|nr:hypothetical protein [Echinicola strongylocentroti]